MPASSLTRSVVVALLTCMISTGLAVAVNFATAEGAGFLPWVAVVVLTLLAALAALLVPKREPDVPPRPPGYPPKYAPYGGQPHGQYASWPPPMARGGRSGGTVSAVAVLLVVILITGVTGGLAYGGWYFTAWFTGTESGSEVLIRPVTKTEGPLTLTIDGVEVTKHLTKVDLTAVNRGGRSISLPLFGNCQLNAGGSTLGTQLFGSRWNDSVPAGDRRVGTIVFAGRPAEGATTATLSFAHVYGTFDPESITIEIPLRAGG